MKFPFDFAVNRIEDKYFVVSADDSVSARTVICCDEISAFLFSCLTEDLSQAQMLDRAKTQYPDTDEETLNSAVLKVRDIVRQLDKNSTELEVLSV